MVKEDNNLSNLGNQLEKLKSPYTPRTELKYQVPPLSKKIDIIYRELQELDRQIKLLEDRVNIMYLSPLFINL